MPLVQKREAKMKTAMKIISTKENTGFMNFPSRSEIVAVIGNERFYADVRGYDQFPLPEKLVWKSVAGDIADIEFNTPLFFR